MGIKPSRRTTFIIITVIIISRGSSRGSNTNFQIRIEITSYSKLENFTGIALA